MAEAKIQELLPGLPRGCSVSRLWAILDCFPKPQKGVGWEVELLKLEPAPIWDLGTFKARTIATKPCHQVQEQNYFQRNTPKLILQQSGGPTTELAWLQAALPITHSTGTWTSFGVMRLLISIARFF